MQNIQLKDATISVQVKAVTETIETRPDLLAYITLVLKDDTGRTLHCTGYTLRRSKHNSGTYLALPSRPTGPGRWFRFALLDEDFTKELHELARDVYEEAMIPVINA